MNPVIIMDYHEPLSLDKLKILVNQDKPILSKNIEKKAKKNWKKFKRKRRNAKDNQIAYLVSYVSKKDRTKAEVFLAGFSYNQFFNRDDKNMVYSGLVNKLNYNPFSSWVIMVCDKGRKALFGNKRDFAKDVICGFGGFTSLEDVVDEKIDANKWIERKLKQESGEKIIPQRVEEIFTTGINYYPMVGPKGFDKTFVVYLDGKVKKIQRDFKENDQFSKKLIAIKANPNAFLDFLEAGHELTPSGIGGVLGYIGSRWGLDELQRVLSAYSKKNVVQILSKPLNGNVRKLTQKY